MSYDNFKSAFNEFTALVVDATKKVKGGKLTHNNENGIKIEYKKATWEAFFMKAVVNIEDDDKILKTISQSFVEFFDKNKDNLSKFTIKEFEFDYDLSWLSPETNSLMFSIPGRRGANLTASKSDDGKVSTFIPLSEIYETCRILNINKCFHNYGGIETPYLVTFIENMLKCIKISLAIVGRVEEFNTSMGALLNHIYDISDYYRDNEVVKGEMANDGISAISKLVESTGLGDIDGSKLNFNNISEIVSNGVNGGVLTKDNLMNVAESFNNGDGSKLKDVIDKLNITKSQNAASSATSSSQE